MKGEKGEKGQAPKPKPVNVFSNDGSFLERFQRIQKVRCHLTLVVVLCVYVEGKVGRG